MAAAKKKPVRKARKTKPGAKGTRAPAAGPLSQSDEIATALAEALLGPKPAKYVERPSSRRGKAGRPYVCTGPIRRAIIVSAFTGLYREDIAVDVGISYRALQRLVADAQFGHRKVERCGCQSGNRCRDRCAQWDVELWRFWRAFRQAELEAQKGLVRTVMSADSAKDALEVLGRRWRRKWGKRTLLANAPDEDDEGNVRPGKGSLSVGPGSARDHAAHAGRPPVGHQCRPGPTPRPG
jgi:hypothetical protein